MKTKVVLSRKLPDNTETRMRELFDTQLNLDDQPLSEAELVEAMKSADVFVPTVTDKITADMITKAGPNLRLIASFGTGIDHIDIVAARTRNIMVTNTPGVLSEDTADVAMALILAVQRRLAEGDKLVRSDGWQGWAPTSMLGYRVNGKRLGIIGMGRIGGAIAKRAHGFGMSVHYHNRNPVHPAIEAELEATYWDNLDDMLRRMDIISVNCPFTEETRGLLSAARLELMAENHACLINTARGEIIDEVALADALASGRLAGAGLDVYADERAIPKALKSLPNTVLLPHIGSATLEGREAMGDKVIINIQTFLDGHTPPDRVLPGMI